MFSYSYHQIVLSLRTGVLGDRQSVWYVTSFVDDILELKYAHKMPFTDIGQLSPKIISLFSTLWLLCFAALKVYSLYLCIPNEEKGRQRFEWRKGFSVKICVNTLICSHFSIF